VPEVEIAVCTRCAAKERREEMYGPSDALVCPACASAIRERYRRRPATRTRTPVVTTAVLAVALTLFVAAHLLRAPWIAYLVVGPGVWAGEAWRFLTSAFLHVGPLFGHTWLGGLLHVGFNAWWIFELGRGIESGWGSPTLLALVVGSAVAASAAQWLAGTSGVGLSGVVYGLAGFLFTRRHSHPIAASLMHPANVQLLVLWFFLCVFATGAGLMAVGNWAHGIGALWGFVAGTILASRWGRLGAAALALATIALTVAAMSPRLQAERWVPHPDPADTGPSHER
jgi:membrane associated rhomboid family serine protease